MRNISAASLAKLAERRGTEPVIIIDVEWQTGQSPASYGDKRADGVDPRILQISSLDDVVNVSRSGTSQSVTLTLDDSDGALKYIFDRVDIHKKRVWIYQWFTGLELSERFLIFAGVIMSPVQWKEGDRTLVFTVASQVTDVEVGFSPEEGQFPNLPQTMVGQVWPLIFGTVAKIPTIRIDDIPYGGGSGDTKTGDAGSSVTKDGTGIEDPALGHAITDNGAQAAYAVQLAQIMFIGYLQASFTARERGELDEFDDISKGKGQFSQLAVQYLNQGNNYLLQSQKIRRKNDSLKQTQKTQKSHEKSSIGVTNGASFPQARPISLNIGGGRHEGQFLGNNFHIASRVHPDSELVNGLTLPVPGEDDINSPTFTRNKFFYADSGTPLMFGITSDSVTDDPATHLSPVRYIIAGTIQVTVVALYAYRTVDQVKSLYPIPGNYYQIDQLPYGTLPVTQAYFPQPLSSRMDGNGATEGWQDEVYATVISPIGPNTVDIIRWIIENYTTHEIDEASFAEVRDLIDTYPSHFALTSRPQAIALIGQIARQARCITWLKNNTFFIKYLPKRADPVSTIVESDIIEQTLEVAYTESEDLITKVVASWKADGISKPNLVILRYNIAYYGMHERRDDYFIYNMQQLVEKSATFWLIREANTYKRVTLKVPLTKLNIETLDTVTLDFSHGFVADGPIDCLVESASVDTGDYTVSLVLWAPVRAGEMSEYDFAWTGDLTVEFVFPTAEDVQTGRAGSGHDVSFNRQVELPPVSASPNPKVTQPFSGDEGNGGSLHVTHRPHTWGADPSYTVDGTDANLTAPQINSRVDTLGSTAALGTKPPGTTRYQIDRAKVKSVDIVPNITGGSFMGKVVSGTADSYTLWIYVNGLKNPPQVVENVRQMQIDPDAQIPAESWTTVTRMVEKKTALDGKVTYDETWAMQFPVWL